MFEKCCSEEWLELRAWVTWLCVWGRGTMQEEHRASKGTQTGPWGLCSRLLAPGTWVSGQSPSMALALSTPIAVEINASWPHPEAPPQPLGKPHTILRRFIAPQNAISFPPHMVGPAWALKASSPFQLRGATQQRGGVPPSFSIFTSCVPCSLPRRGALCNLASGCRHVAALIRVEAGVNEGTSGFGVQGD